MPLSALPHPRHRFAENDNPSPNLSTDLRPLNQYSRIIGDDPRRQTLQCTKPVYEIVITAGKNRSSTGGHPLLLSGLQSACHFSAPAASFPRSLFIFISTNRASARPRSGRL